MKNQHPTAELHTGNVTITLQNGSILSLPIIAYLHSSEGTIIISQLDSDTHFAFSIPPVAGAGQYNVAYPIDPLGEYPLKWGLNNNGIRKMITNATMGFSSKNFQNQIDGNAAGTLDDGMTFTAKFSYTRSNNR